MSPSVGQPAAAPAAPAAAAPAAGATAVAAAEAATATLAATTAATRAAAAAAAVAAAVVADQYPSQAYCHHNQGAARCREGERDMQKPHSGKRIRRQRGLQRRHLRSQ